MHRQRALVAVLPAAIRSRLLQRLPWVALAVAVAAGAAHAATRMDHQRPASVSGTQECGALPQGATTWNALGSPYLLCANGVSVPAGAQLTIDAALGAVQVEALGNGGLSVPGGQVQTANTSVHAVTFDGAATAGSWAGLLVGSQGSSAGTLSLQNSTVADAVTGVAANAAGSVTLTGVTVLRAQKDGVAAVGTALSLTGSTIDTSGQDGVRIDCTGAEGVAVDDTLVTSATAYGIEIAGCTHPHVQRDTVTSSGAGSLRYPAVSLRMVTVSVGPGCDVDSDVGGGNGIDLLLLGGRITASLQWISPSNSASVHPLGYATTGLLIGPGATMSVPAGGVVKSSGSDPPDPTAPFDPGASIAVEGGTLDASAGGAIFTSVSDDSVGIPTCGTVLAPGCTPVAGDWGGIGLLHAQDGSNGSATLDGATVRHAAIGVCGCSSQSGAPLSLTDTVVDDSRTNGILIADNHIPGYQSAGASVVRGSVTHTGGDGVVIETTSGTTITGLSISDVAGAGVVTSGASAPCLSGVGVSRAHSFGIHLLGTTAPRLSGNLITDSGTGTATYPAIALDSTSTFSTGAGGIGDNQGGGNGIDAIDLAGTPSSSFTWLTPVDAAGPHALGYISDGLTIPGNVVLTIPANAVVKMGSSLLVPGGTLDATAGGATFTDYLDSTVGVPVCPSAGFVADCSATTGHWGGILLDPPDSKSPQGNAAIYGALVRTPAQGIVATGTATATVGSSQYGLVLRDTVIDHPGTDGVHLGAYLTAAPATSISGGAIIAAGRNGVWSEVYGENAAPLSVSGVTINQPTLDGIRVDTPTHNVVVVSGNTITGAGQYGVELRPLPSWTADAQLNASQVTVTGNVVTGCGTGATRYAAMTLGYLRSSVGPGGQVDANVGGGNGFDAIVFEGIVTSDLTWITPVNGAAMHPLGYLITNHLLQSASFPVSVASLQIVGGHNAVFPAGAVVKLAGGISVAPGGHLDASAGGAVFAGLGDNSVGLPVCPSAFTPNYPVPDPCTSPHQGAQLSFPATTSGSPVPASAWLRGATILGGGLYGGGMAATYPGMGFSYIIEGTAIREFGTPTETAPPTVDTAGSPTHITGSTIDGGVSATGPSTLIDHDVFGNAIKALTTGGGAVVTAVRVTNDSYESLQVNGAATISCVTISAGGGTLAHGEYVYGGSARGPSATVTDSDLYGNANASTGRSDLASWDNTDARGNWWGQPGGPNSGQVTGYGASDTSSPLGQQSPSMVVSTTSGNPEPGGVYGPGTLTVSLAFGPRHMETLIQPLVTLTGPDGVQHVIGGAWNDPYHWTGTYTIASNTARSGANTLSVSGARSCVPDPATNLAPSQSRTLVVDAGTTASYGDPSANRKYVAAVYQDLLGRAPDAGGLDHWATAIDRGQPRYQIALSFTASAEYRGSQVQADYQRFLHRPADGSLTGGGERFWIDWIAAGGTFEGLQESLVASDEYLFSRGGGTIDGYVTAVYRDVLGRDPDDGGRAYWDARLSGGEPRATIVAAFLTSFEAYQQRVSSWYQASPGGALMHHAPDDAGRDYWARLLQQGLRDEDVISSLVGSDEYYGYAGSH